VLVSTGGFVTAVSPATTYVRATLLGKRDSVLVTVRTP
jgi:hypothetical protein